MAYNNQGNNGGGEGYDKSKDIVIYKGAVKSEKRYLNVEVYSYNGGPTSVRIRINAKNTNPEQTDPKKQWVPQKGISQLNKVEIEGLLKELTNALKEL